MHHHWVLRTIFYWQISRTAKCTGPYISPSPFPYPISSPPAVASVTWSCFPFSPWELPRGKVQGAGRQPGQTPCPGLSRSPCKLSWTNNNSVLPSSQALRWSPSKASWRRVLWVVAALSAPPSSGRGKEASVGRSSSLRVQCSASQVGSGPMLMLGR